MFTWSFSILILFILLIKRGVKDKETNVAILSPGFKDWSGNNFPTSLTLPINIPPLPVTGFCILPLSFTIFKIISSIFTISLLQAFFIWVKEAESIFKVITPISNSLSFTTIVLSILVAACGKTPLGVITLFVPYLHNFPIIFTPLILIFF